MKDIKNFLNIDEAQKTSVGTLKNEQDVVDAIGDILWDNQEFYESVVLAKEDGHFDYEELFNKKSFLDKLVKTLIMGAREQEVAM